MGAIPMAGAAAPMRPVDIRVDPDPGLRPVGSLQRQPGAGDGAPNRTVRLGAGPLSRYMLVVALLAVATAVAYVGTRERGSVSVAVLVPKADMAAFHALTMADVTVETRQAGHGERFATVPVDGRLTMRAVRKGQPLVLDDVSPDVTAALGQKPVVTGIKVSHAGAFAGDLRAGQRIDLVLVRDNQKVAELGAIVLTAKPAGADSQDWTLVVGMREADSTAHQVDLATSEISVFRDPASADAPR